eukprot:1745678-Pyramimonas_sp.AAC.1
MPDMLTRAPQCHPACHLKASRKCGATWAHARAKLSDSEITANGNEIKRIWRPNKHDGMPEDYAELPSPQLQGPPIGPIINEELGANTVAPATVPTDAEEISNAHPAADNTHTTNQHADTNIQDPSPSIIIA